MSRLVANAANFVLRPLGIRMLPEWELRVLKSANPRLEFFRRLGRRGFQPRHVVDVGAHKGHWSLDAASVFPGCAFTLIEPLLEMKPYLDDACKRIGKARWLQAGAGEADGEAEFTARSRLDASSFAAAGSRAPEQGSELRKIRVLTVDSACAGSPYPPPDVVKIDAEGLDLAVMRGCAKQIGKTELFFLETPLLPTVSDQTFDSMTEFMRDNGYEPYDFTEFIRDPVDETLGAVEIAFVRKDGQLRSSYKSGW